jgi:DNA-binding response OmpR family regulator
MIPQRQINLLSFYGFGFSACSLSDRHSGIGFNRGSGVKILVVEDEKRMAQALRRGLEEERYAVTVTADGISAVQLAETDHFDLILLDLMLPGIDGFEVTRRLRGTAQSVPILMLTARDAVPDM